jgi:hypothetical protein
MNATYSRHLPSYEQSGRSTMIAGGSPEVWALHFAMRKIE